jgi:VanZ family protein
MFMSLGLLRRLAGVGATAWLAAVCALSLMPTVPPLVTRASDKVQHLGAYGLLALLSTTALSGRVRCWWVCIACAMLGAAIEFVQPLTGRAFDYADMAANSAGAVLGTTASVVVVAVVVRRAGFRKDANLQPTP